MSKRRSLSDADTDRDTKVLWLLRKPETISLTRAEKRRGRNFTVHRWWKRPRFSFGMLFTWRKTWRASINIYLPAGPNLHPLFIYFTPLYIIYLQNCLFICSFTNLFYNDLWWNGYFNSEVINDRQKYTLRALWKLLESLWLWYCNHFLRTKFRQMKVWGSAVKFAVWLLVIHMIRIQKLVVLLTSAHVLIKNGDAGGLIPSG